MEVIAKEGLLYLQGFKFGKKIWRKIWMVLFKPSSSGVGRLEFANIVDSTNTDQKKAGRQKTPEKRVVRLSDCLSITPATKEYCLEGYTCFYLNTTQCLYTMASTTSPDWISTLCLLAFQKDPGEADKGVLERGNVLAMEDNELYSSWKRDVTVPTKCYPVTIQSTEASRWCKLAGEYLVSLEDKAVTLLATNTRRVVYRWPHRLLRKFGMIEGGVSIEAGRRCDSGEGVFIFLSEHSHLIFQAISEQCSLERSLSAQTPKSLSDPNMSGGAAGHLPSAQGPADVLDHTEDMYSTIKLVPAAASILPSSVEPQLCNSQEAVGAEDAGQDEWLQSMEALKLEGDEEESIYYNLRRATPSPARRDRLSDGTNNSECIYADVSVFGYASDLQAQPFSPLGPEEPTSAQFASYSALRPRYQHQPVNYYLPSGCSAQKQPVDDNGEQEEAMRSSVHTAPTKLPGSFKNKLAEIISKDLAKFQPAPPTGSGGPAFTQY